MRFAPCLLSAALLFPAFAGADAVLRTAADINAFQNGLGDAALAFDMTGVVSSVSSGHVTVEDGTAHTWLYLESETDDRLHRGDRAHLSGTAVRSAFSAHVTVTNLLVVGPATPSPPVDVRIADIDEFRMSFADLRTTGVVVDVLPDEIDDRYNFLLLKDGAARLPASIDVACESNPARFIGARVAVTGTFFRGIRGTRKYSGPVLVSTRVDVLEPPPEDPFAAAPRLETAWYLTPREVSALDNRRIRGEVLAVWSGNRLIVRTDDGRKVNVRLARDVRPPAVGSTAEIIGYPQTDLFWLNLSNARWRPAALPPVKETAAAVSPQDILFGTTGQRGIESSFHGRLIRLRGLVRSLPSEGSAEKRLSLDSGKFRFPVDVSSCPDAATGIEVGAEIEVTGRCLIETSDWTVHDAFPQATGFVLIARSADDFRVLVRPPWWTPARLMTAVAILLAGLAAIILWNLTLQVLVKQRAEELSKADFARAASELRVQDRTRLSVELHDSLSQCLTGVSMEVESAIRHGAGNPEKQRQHLLIADRILKSCRNELRNTLWDLRNESLEDTDLEQAIRRALLPHVKDIELRIRFSVPRSLLTDNTTHEVLRIIRELAVNGISHGGATRIQIAGSLEDGKLLFSVKDNGGGFDPDTVPGVLQGHFGLEGIRERLRPFKGVLSFASAAGKGTKATVTIPLPKELA